MDLYLLNGFGQQLFQMKIMSNYIIFLNYSYYCLKMDLVYLSGTTVILTLLACYFGYAALD